MKFSKDKAIYLQIADILSDTILSGTWAEESRIPSIKDMAVSMEVNPNTVVRSYTCLQDHDIIYNRRGVGYFVARDAGRKILAMKREAFVRSDIPRLVNNMKLLRIDFEELERLCRPFLTTESE